MALPDFVGIGAPRAGTSWLNTLLASHPDVYTPTIRDEINFFDRYYRRGVGWYESLFPVNGEGSSQVRGEVTPQYLYCPECPQRISDLLPDVKLIVMLRHPVDRAYSQYGLFVQRRNYRRSFPEFLEDKPFSIEKGYYSGYLERYFTRFDRERFLFLLFEEAIGELDQAKRTLGGFLGVDPARFPPTSGQRKINPSSRPRMQRLSGFAAGVARQLRRLSMEPVVDLVMRKNIHRVLIKGSPMPPLDPELRQALTRPFEHEFERLETLTGLDLSIWRR